ncbi:MAG: pentapeptide repeat-containing protein [Desulfoprunum sp.]|uniref:pentapeptide repeat-containing protein n=1 Tax=Desulfoprunum sp. TaxID=2020866 RepID=UPI003C765D0D
MYAQLSSICLLATIALLSGCATGNQERMLQEGKTQLTAEQIFQSVSGNTLHLKAIDFNARVHFLDSGRMAGRSSGNSHDTGTWDVNSDNQLCLKFDTWYYGDERCYSMVETGADIYALFTSNGARAYTATAAEGDPEKLATAGRKKDKAYLRAKMADGRPKAGGGSAAAETEPAPAQPPRVIPSPPPSPEEVRHTLAYMAKNCPNCNLAGADLKGVDLITANLAGANLAGADLSRANLRRANLAGANLAGAILVNANLLEANLANCNMSNADLSGASLIKANLTGAMTEGVRLEGAQLDGVVGLGRQR